jgi:hypothetical protein
LAFSAKASRGPNSAWQCDEPADRREHRKVGTPHRRHLARHEERTEKAIKVSNEPWLPGFWGGKPNPVQYPALVR